MKSSIAWWSALVLALAGGSAAAATPWPAGINDSGQTTCHAGATEEDVAETACTDADWPGQDGASGRDAAAAAGALDKLGSGAAGFDFTRISNAGTEMGAGAVPGQGATFWGCTRDNVTGLLWRVVLPAPADFVQALDAVEALNTAGACGHDDWRLPDAAELMGLVHFGTERPAIDADYFPDTPAGFHWTADLRPDGRRAQAVNFNGGFSNAIEVAARATVRAVRGGHEDTLRRTAGGQLVTDSGTGLQWAACAAGQRPPYCLGKPQLLSWQDALQLAAERNAEAWLGHDDWRLPNVKELATLLDPQAGRPAIDAGRFPNTAPEAHWSATTNEAVPRTAWAVFFGGGNVFAKGKETAAAVRLVRSGAPGIGGAPRPAADLAALAAAVAADEPEEAPPPVPLLELTTVDGAEIDRHDYVAGTLEIHGGDPEHDYVGPMQIHGRGNSTWTAPKKPWRIKLDAKAPLLGMPKSKHWVLLANHFDKSLLRTELAFTLGEALEMAWTPRARSVEVVLNGEYIGLYQLVEKIRIASKRVAITEMEPGDVSLPEVSGGYLFEFDDRRNCPEHVQIDTLIGVPICIDRPKDSDIAPEQVAYLSDYLKGLELALYGGDFTDPDIGYAAWLEPLSFSNWYIVNEFLTNVDARSWSSIWNHKDRDGKLVRGPLWDFDLAAGNAAYCHSCAEPRGFWIRGGYWYDRLFQDPAWVLQTRARWQALRAGVLADLPGWIDAHARVLAPAAARNFERWPVLDRDVRAKYNVVVTGSWEGELAYLKDWLEQRIVWLDANLCPLVIEVPLRPTAGCVASRPPVRQAPPRWAR